MKILIKALSSQDISSIYHSIAMILHRVVSLLNIGFRYPARNTSRSLSWNANDNYNNKDEKSLKEDISLTGIHLDDIDKIMSSDALDPINYYPKLDVDPLRLTKPLQGHNIMVIQPWESYMNFGQEMTDPQLQLDECVSLCNTIQNWNVVSKKIIFSRFLKKKTLFSQKLFAELKDEIIHQPGASAVFFGVEVLSGVQLKTIEQELKMPCYDRFTVVLNIFRQHARTNEAKIQVALAELPYIKANLREIHESSEYSSTSESIKTIIGGISERHYHQRLNILKRREQKLRGLLEKMQNQRDLAKKSRRKSNVPIVSIVGYTNCGKTSLVKYLTSDEKVIPQDQLFATLDVTTHGGNLPSVSNVLYQDTVGFLSRIPILLIEAFSATLKDVQDSDLIVHVLDITHPDSRLQYSTVLKALESIKVRKDQLRSKITVGNKIDLITQDELERRVQSIGAPRCDLYVSIINGTNMPALVEAIDRGLSSNLRQLDVKIRVSNGGADYLWLRSNTTIKGCSVDEKDGNFLVCCVSMSPTAIGRWSKRFGLEGVLTNVEAFTPKKSLY